MEKVMDYCAIFGASGTLGNAIVTEIELSGSTAIKISRDHSDSNYLSTSNANWVNEIKSFKNVTGFVWTQGLNKSDSIVNFDINEFNDHIQANVGYILETIHKMLANSAIQPGARLVIVSSIWQDYAKAQKLSYITSKSALRGLVSSLAIDLAKLNIAVNAVLPGVIESPMTRKNLTKSQVDFVVQETPMGKLATPENVAKTVKWLASENSIGITGQFITVDNGWSRYRNV